MREGSAKKNSYGKSRNGRTNINMEGQRSNAGDEGKLVNVFVFPIVLHGAETWTMRKHERRKIDSFELWCWRRVLRVSWMERKTNIWIIENHTGMDIGVKGDKGCIKLLWARSESRMDGRWRDDREKERKTEKEMAGHTQGVFERRNPQQHEPIRQR